MLSLLIASLWLVPAPPAPLSTLTARVRPLSNITRAILNEAQRRSPTIQHLVAELQNFDTIVYIELGFETMGDHGITSMLTSAGPLRMVRVVLSAKLDPPRRIEVLGHELYHALEIARAGEVRDAGTFRALYERIGYAMSPTSFETDGARAAEQQVHAELSARASAPPAPRGGR